MYLTDEAFEMLHEKISEHIELLKAANAFRNDAEYGLRISRLNNEFKFEISAYPDKDDKIIKKGPIFLDSSSSNLDAIIHHSSKFILIHNKKDFEFSI